MKRLLLCLLLAVAPAGAAPRSAPPNPYIDRDYNAFDYCTSSDWEASQPIMLLDRPDGRARIANLPAGAIVHGLSSIYISSPARLVAKHDYPDAPIRAGDSLYVLHHNGEGIWTVWFRGKLYGLDLTDYRADAGPLASLNDRLWLKVRSGNGHTGWVLHDRQFKVQGGYCE